MQLSLFSADRGKQPAGPAPVQPGLSFCEQTGWAAVHPLMICQDPVVLSRCTRFTYNLNDARFREYYVQRYGVLIFERLLPWFPEKIYDNPHYDRWVLESPNCCGHMPDNPLEKGAPMTLEKRRELVKRNKVTRGSLQCAWDIYTKQRGIESGVEPWSITGEEVGHG